MGLHDPVVARADSQLRPGARYQSVCFSVVKVDKTLLPVSVLSFQRGGI